MFVLVPTIGHDILHRIKGGNFHHSHFSSKVESFSSEVEASEKNTGPPLPQRASTVWSACASGCAQKRVLHSVNSRFIYLLFSLLFFGDKVLHIQNPGKMQAFGDVAGWLKETTGTDLEGVTLDEFRERIGKAVEEKDPHDVGVLAKVCYTFDSMPVLCYHTLETFAHSPNQCDALLMYPVFSSQETRLLCWCITFW